MTSPADLALQSAPDHPGRLEFVRYVRGGVAPGHAAAILAHCLVCDTCAMALGVMLQDHGYRPVAVGGPAPGKLVLLPGR